MDDQIAFSEFTEIDLGAVTFGAAKPQEPSWVDCESSEQLCGGKDDEIGRWKTKSARKRTLDEIDPFDGACHNFAEPLDLAFSLKINYDPGVIGAPFFQALDELRPFCLGEHEIAGTKLSNLAILKRAPKIFQTVFNPAFTDFDVWRGELRRAWRHSSSAIHWWLDIDDQISLADVIANRSALVRRPLIQQNINRSQIAH